MCQDLKLVYQLGSETPWLFGYGSLIWRPAFPFVQRRPARLWGWARRFWQASVDHRGVPGQPGRVVTLVRKQGAWCDGVAFRLPDGHRDAVLESLDHRERGGYQRHRVTLHHGANQLPNALVYVATAENEHYAGPAPLETIARQILDAAGPSGPNPEYLLRLAESLHDLGAKDPHVYSLERLVKESQARVAPS